jgi:hypothetical protein
MTRSSTAVAQTGSTTSLRPASIRRQRNPPQPWRAGGHRTSDGGRDLAARGDHPAAAADGRPAGLPQPRREASDQSCQSCRDGVTPARPIRTGLIIRVLEKHALGHRLMEEHRLPVHQTVMERRTGGCPEDPVGERPFELRAEKAEDLGNLVALEPDAVEVRKLHHRDDLVDHADGTAAARVRGAHGTVPLHGLVNLPARCRQPPSSLGSVERTITCRPTSGQRRSPRKPRRELRVGCTPPGACRDNGCRWSIQAPRCQDLPNDTEDPGCAGGENRRISRTGAMEPSAATSAPEDQACTEASQDRAVEVAAPRAWSPDSREPSGYWLQRQLHGRVASGHQATPLGRCTYSAHRDGQYMSSPAWPDVADVPGGRTGSDRGHLGSALA